MSTPPPGSRGPGPAAPAAAAPAPAAAPPGIHVAAALAAPALELTLHAAAAAPPRVFSSAAALAPVGVPRSPPTDTEQRLFRFAGATALDNVATRRLFEQYRDGFDRAVENDCATFAAAGFTADECSEINLRVTTAIRRVASFTAWYGIVGVLFRQGYALAWLAGLVTVLALAVTGYVHDWNALVAAGSTAIGGLAVAVVQYGARRLTRSWPLDAIACVVALGIFTMALRYGWLYSISSVWLRITLVAACGIAAFAGVLLVVLLIVHRLHAWTTATKLRLYPEDEIIQSLLAALGRVQAQGQRAWVSGVVRQRIVNDLDWIACRFERDFLGRFCRGDATTDTWLRETSAQFAAACRLRSRMVACPQPGGFGHVAQYARDTLLYAARSEWMLIEQAPATPTSPKRRALDSLTDAGKIAFPAAAGIVAWNLSVLPDPIRQNALFTGLLASVVALWGVVDPQRSDKGLANAKTLGDLLKPPSK